MFTLILPCAGNSSRYPNMRPKWSLTHPNGRLMITQGISGLDLSNFDSICMGALKEDVGFRLSSLINNFLIPRLEAKFFASKIGVNPSPNEIIFSS